MEYKADSLFKNQFFNFSIQILNMLFPLIAIPYVTRLFGPDILGEINFASSIVQYFMLLAVAGIPIYAVREVARVRDDKNALRKKFTEITIIQVTFTSISIITYLILVFSIKSLQANIYIYLFLGIQILSNAFNFTWFIQGIEKYRYVAIATFISKLINIILVFTLLKGRNDYNIYAFIIGITTLINVLINLFTTKKLFKSFTTSDKIIIDYTGIKSHIYAILVFFLSDIAVKVYTAMDQTMLGIMKSKDAVGYYSMAIRLVKTILTFVTSVVVVMLPRISNSIKHNKLDEVKKYISVSIKLVYIVAIPSIFGILAIGEEVVTIYLGVEFLQSIVIFKLTSILLIIIGLSNIFGMQVMIPFGKEKKYTVILGIAAILNFIINLILIPKLSYFGAAYATILAEGIVTILMYKEVKKLVGNIPQIRQVIKYLIPSTIFYIVIKFLVKPFINSSIKVILISIPLALIIYALGLILLKEELCLELMSRIKKKLKR